MSPSLLQNAWGQPPWQIDFSPAQQPLPDKVDFAIIGGGFTGLAAAAWLRLHAPDKSVAVLEAGRIGAGASGRTGGMVLAESAAGDLPGLGDVLAGLTHILEDLGRACGISLIENCELALPGAWEIARKGGLAESPISWNDSGILRVVNEVPGGTVHPGKLVEGLARAAERLGAVLIEHVRVERVDWGADAKLVFAGGNLRARKVLFATNGLSLGLSGLNDRAHPRLTLAASTAPLDEEELDAIGLSQRKPFYTVDFPYLWGRVCRDNSIVWGAGLVSAEPWGSVEQIDIAAEESSRMFAALERRIRRLRPGLEKLDFTHRWGGPILFRDGWEPVFDRHPASESGVVLGAFAGHGVALSVYLGTWAAEIMRGRRNLPEWGRITESK
jgi:glycine/D-amino acid oxidase-like deaminating enzyme